MWRPSPLATWHYSVRRWRSGDHLQSLPHIDLFHEPCQKVLVRHRKTAVLRRGTVCCMARLVYQRVRLSQPRLHSCMMHLLFHRIFDIKDNLREWNARKDHLWNFLSKKTPYGWWHVWPGDTWHVPPGPTPAWGCRHQQRRHVAWHLTPFVAICHSGPCRLPRCRHADVAPCRQR
jgi:hypothetical protein